MLVKYTHHNSPIEQIKKLLSYAVGFATDEKLSNILEHVYSQGDSTLYVCTENDGRVLGILGLRREGASAEILHIAVDEHKRNCGIGRRMIDELLVLENPTELTAETDNDAVGFYRQYGFRIQSLGHKYPGVERFHCRLLLGQGEELRNISAEGSGVHLSFWRAIGRLFRRNKVCVYVALGNKDLFRATGKLQDAGIPYRTRIPGILAGVNGGSNPPVVGSDFNEYEVYVKREYEEQARFVLGT